MSRWLARALQQTQSLACAPIAPLAPKGPASGAIGANGTNGTAPEAPVQPVRPVGSKSPDPAPLAPLVPKDCVPGAIGANGANGTAPEIYIAERQAIAEIEGNVPPLYSTLFARLQTIRPEGARLSDWRQAIDDAGAFLDSHGHAAASLGWHPDNVFGAGGLLWSLRGATVSSLQATAAILSDGRVIHRSAGCLATGIEHHQAETNKERHGAISWN